MGHGTDSLYCVPAHGTYTYAYCTIDGNMNYVVAEPGAALPLAAAH